jgi:hypothetical protein
MLHGGVGNFERYDIEDNWWDDREEIPGFVGYGGALAYVPDPFAYPQNGYVFALKGEPSWGFYVYRPGSDQWYPATDVPERVEAGGALCYGGTCMINGLRYAIVYAFSGSEHLDENDVHWGHFYRYVFPLVPYDGPVTGTWERLRDIPGSVEAGGALAWCPNVGPPAGMGYVLALRGGGDNAIWRYDPAAPAQPWQNEISFEPPGQGGAAMASLPDGASLVFIHGGGGNAFSHYDAGYPTVTPLGPTLEAQYDGAALAQFDWHPYSNIWPVFPPPPRRRFWRYDFQSPDGGQGRGAATIPDMQVRVLAEPGRHVLRVRTPPGALELKVVNSAGVVVGSDRAMAVSGEAALTWEHGAATAGVYFYSVVGPAGTVTGKLVNLE